MGSIPDVVRLVLQLIGVFGVVFIALVLIAPAAVKRLLFGWIDQRFDQNMEVFKHDLHLEAERVRHEFGKRIADFSLFTTRRHESYSDIYSKLLKADGKIRGLYTAIEFGPTFEEADRADFEKYLDQTIGYGGKKAELLAVWDTDREKAVSELNRYLKDIAPSTARQLLQDAKNVAVLGAIYLSPRVDAVIWEWIKLLQRMLNPFLFSGPSGTPRIDVKAFEIEKEAIAKQAEARRLIQEELAGLAPYQEESQARSRAEEEESQSPSE